MHFQMPAAMDKQKGPPKEGEEKPRTEVMDERKRKKEEAKLRKEQAKVNAKTNSEPTQKQQQQSKTQKNGPGQKVQKDQGKKNAENQPSEGTQKQQPKKPQKHNRQNAHPQSSENQGLPSQLQALHITPPAPMKSALKNISPDSDKSNLQVRFGTTFYPFFNLSFP